MTAHPMARTLRSVRRGLSVGGLRRSGVVISQHVVNPNQGGIHDLLAGADGNRCGQFVRAVTAYRDGFDGGKVLLISIAETQEQNLHAPKPFS